MRLVKPDKHPRNKVIFIDVDGTLKLSIGLNQTLVDWCRTRKNEGFEIVLWSARGRVYAENYANQHERADLFSVIVSKPGYIVDDKGWGWIKYTNAIDLGEIL